MIKKTIIEPYIQDYMSNNDEGILTLYVPLVLVIKNGKVIDGHEGTLDSHDATERKMTDDEKEELTKIYTKLMSESKLASLFLFSSYFNLIIEAQLSNQ